MLTRTMISEDVLLVKETLHSFTKTKVSYRYYNIRDWTVNQLGKEGEIPTHPMDQGSIDWCKKYHLPKAQKGY